MWRRFSYLRVHGTFLSRVPIRHATERMPAPTIPHHMREPDAYGEARNTGLESPVHPPTRKSALRLLPQNPNESH